MAVNRKGGPWPGGYISVGKGGRLTFFIEREVGGIRFHVSTRCHNLRAAMKQLERFEGNPTAYKPEGGAELPLILCDELRDEYRQWCLTKKKPNATKHAREKYNLLGEWRDDLRGRDIRTLNIRELNSIVDERRTSRQHRIIAIKSFCSWLRRVKGLLRTSTDPTLDLPVPQGDPEKHRRRKVVEIARVAAAIAKLPERYRDAIVLIAATGMHVTELCRFARDDDSELVRPASGPVLAVLITKHKSGDATRIPLTHVEHVEAAERIRARRSVPRYLNRVLKAACREAGVAEFTPGMLRHSVATWAIESGATPEEIAQFLGHKDKRTTLRFYVDSAVPTVSVPVPVLH